MKKVSKLMAMALALFMVLSLAAPAKADNYDPTVKGTSTTLTKYLVVENDAEIPEAEFTFTVSAGAAVPGSATELPVLAGPNPELVKVNTEVQTGKVNFTAGETTYPGASGDGITDDDQKKYASKTIALDFSDVTFTEPGVYRYLITETTPTAPIEAVGETVTTVDVYVEDDNGALIVAGYVAYDGTEPGAPKNNEATGQPDADASHPEGATKDAKFVNKMDSINLTVSKTVNGNQGSKDQYFEFTITITGAGAGTVLTLDMSGAETSTTENAATTYDKADMDDANQRDDDPSPTKTGQQIICNGSGNATVTVYLQHGQSAVLKGLPKGASYTVVETKDDTSYKTEGEVLTAVQAGDDDVEVPVINTRGGVIPTGVFLAAVPGTILTGGALLYLFGKKRHEDEE